jgi:hypothetical protein
MRVLQELTNFRIYAIRHFILLNLQICFHETYYLTIVGFKCYKQKRSHTFSKSPYSETGKEKHEDEVSEC